jgi:hypothetical protein
MRLSASRNGGGDPRLRLFSGIRFSDPPERARCGGKKEQHIQENREQGEPHGAGHGQPPRMLGVERRIQ